MKIIAATLNKHKITEIESIVKKYGMDVISRSEAGIPDVEIDETGTTFEENSFIKANFICELTGTPTIADDSGLEVDALNGAPGVYSARYAGIDGENADEENNKKLLIDLEKVPEEKRTARFVSVITLLFPDGTKLVARGECDGHIAFQKLGDNGFGYDPLFIPKGYEQSFAQIPVEKKNEISHRANALKKLSILLAKS